VTCTIQVIFLPTATGSRSGVLTVYGNVAGGQVTATLSGTGGNAAPIVLDPISLAFPSTTINATSLAQNITISNTGSNSIALQVPAVVGTDFKITTDTCGASLGASTGCTVSIVFIPTGSGVRSGTFTITDGAGTQTSSLTGSGTSPATDALSPLALTFATQQLSTASLAQQITLTNSGDLPLTLIAAQIISGDFSVVNACGNSLNAHSSCAINVAFQPKNVGTITGLLTVSDQYRTQSVVLSGTGVAPPGVSLAPVSAVSFSPTGVGVTSAAQTVTLTNNGGVSLLVQSVVVTGDFVIVAGSSTCGNSVAANTACTLQVAFAPTVGGPRSGTLTVTDNAASSPQVLSLTGTGVDFTLNPNGGTSLTIANGQNAVYPLLLSSAANIPGTVTFTCTGIPANSSCNVTPSSVALGSTTTVSVTVLTGVSSTSLFSQPMRERPRMLWLAILLPAGLPVLRRKRLWGLAAFALLGCLIAVIGCGAGRAIPLESGSNPNPPIAVTPAGTYTIVASASSGGLIRTVNLTLIVQ
jgi:Abnormal spindle-like microcephaly-assoc'd, ASPM-SPD-2-Hydin